MRNSSPILLGLLALVSAAPTLAAPSTPPALDPQAEIALRGECQGMANQIVQGYLLRQQGAPAPKDELALAGYGLPQGTDIAAQATRLRRECVKQAVGRTDPTWAAIEVMAQANALSRSALGCVLRGISFDTERDEAELELAGCHSPEYPGVPAVYGGGAWKLQLGDNPTGPVLNIRARLTGEDSGNICTLVNQYRAGNSNVTCQVRDSYSQVSLALPLGPSQSQQEVLNDAIKRMVDDYRRANPAAVSTSGSQSGSVGQ